MQIAYAQTEGYIPVTSQAQQSEDYLDYLSRSGEDFDKHYWVKIAASQIMLDNIDNTFVTPVFNGSASLRDAAGQLIENTVKGVNRGDTVDEAFMQELFDDVTALYRLDSTGGALGSGKQELGELPGTAKALLGVLALAWVGIGAYLLIDYLRKKKVAENSQKH